MPVKVILLDNYVQWDYLGSNGILKSMYPYKLDKHYDDKNQKSYQNRPIDSFYFCMEIV